MPLIQTSPSPRKLAYSRAETGAASSENSRRRIGEAPPTVLGMLMREACQSSAPIPASTETDGLQSDQPAGVAIRTR